MACHGVVGWSGWLRTCERSVWETTQIWVERLGLCTICLFTRTSAINGELQSAAEAKLVRDKRTQAVISGFEIRSVPSTAIQEHHRRRHGEYYGSIIHPPTTLALGGFIICIPSVFTTTSGSSQVVHKPISTPFVWLHLCCRLSVVGSLPPGGIAYQSTLPPAH